MGKEISLRSQQLGKQLGRCKPFLPVPRRSTPYYVHDQYNRGAEPPVQESHQDKKRFPERQLPGKDALSGQPECGEEVDTEIPELGPGTEPADSPLWGTADPVSVK